MRNLGHATEPLKVLRPSHLTMGGGFYDCSWKLNPERYFRSARVFLIIVFSSSQHPLRPTGGHGSLSNVMALLAETQKIQSVS